MSGNERERLSIDAAAQILSADLRSTLSVAELSRRIGLNRNKITKGFRAHYGATPAEFSREAKLIHAQNLVTDSDSSMFEIACESGYHSQASFSRAYRARFGQTPRDARKGKKGNGDSAGKFGSNRLSGRISPSSGSQAGN